MKLNDDIIRTPEDLARLLREKNLPNVKIFVMDEKPEIKLYDPDRKIMDGLTGEEIPPRPDWIEKLKIRLECLKDILKRRAK